MTSGVPCTAGSFTRGVVMMLYTTFSTMEELFWTWLTRDWNSLTACRQTFLLDWDQGDVGSSSRSCSQALHRHLGWEFCTSGALALLAQLLNLPIGLRCGETKALQCSVQKASAYFVACGNKVWYPQRVPVQGAEAWVQHMPELGQSL